MPGLFHALDLTKGCKELLDRTEGNFHTLIADLHKERTRVNTPERLSENYGVTFVIGHSYSVTAAKAFFSFSGLYNNLIYEAHKILLKNSKELVVYNRTQGN
jgi:hypothetical protein